MINIVKTKDELIFSGLMLMLMIVILGLAAVFAHRVFKGKSKKDIPTLLIAAGTLIFGVYNIRPHLEYILDVLLKVMRTP